MEGITQLDCLEGTKLDHEMRASPKQVFEMLSFIFFNEFFVLSLHFHP